jgi:hypothetical protein
MELSDATEKTPATPGIDTGTFQFVAQCLNHYGTPGPTRLASNEIFSPSNKIHREVSRAKNLSAPLYIMNECNIIRKVKLFLSTLPRRKEGMDM